MKVIAKPVVAPTRPAGASSASIVTHRPWKPTSDGAGDRGDRHQHPNGAERGTATSSSAATKPVVVEREQHRLAARPVAAVAQRSPT